VLERQMSSSLETPAIVCGFPRTAYYELKCVPSSPDIDVLAPSFSEGDCIWRQGGTVKMRP
jgi:hypothetical protein